MRSIAKNMTIVAITLIAGCLIAFAGLSFVLGGVATSSEEKFEQVRQKVLQAQPGGVQRHAASFEQLSQSLLMIDQADQELEQASKKLQQTYRKAELGQDVDQDLVRLSLEMLQTEKNKDQAFQELGETEQLFYRAQEGWKLAVQNADPYDDDGWDQAFQEMRQALQKRDLAFQEWQQSR